MKVFITASSGVGKTAIVNELTVRGYTAYDTDDRNMGGSSSPAVAAAATFGRSD